MAGVKGRGGPPPKRASQRRRRNTPAAGEAEQVADPHAVVIPPADETWHPVARMWFDSLAASGQSQFYTSSDWATAYLLAESMSRELHPQPMLIGKGADAHWELVARPPTGASMAAWLKGMAALMTTEGERRRARLELERTPPAGAGGGGGGGGSVSWLDAARRSSG